MSKMQYIDNVDARFQEMLTAILQSRSAVTAAADSHLDQDTLAAFAEGGLSERELMPAVAHLADCGFCRNISSDLMQLEGALILTDDPISVARVAESASLGEAISSWFGRLFGNSEAGVFAHSEPEEDNTDPEAEKDEDDDETSTKE